MKRIKDKIKEINEYLSELKDIIPSTFDMSEIIPPNEIGGLKTTSTTRRGMISEHVKNRPTKEGTQKHMPPSKRAVFNEYKSNIMKKAACERYVEKIIEAVTDLAFLIIKNKKLKIPEDDIDAFNILLDNKIIKEDLFKKLKDAKGMRNIIAHQYGEIDDKIVYDAIKEELERDVDEFIKAVKKQI